jgi:hypothetical protein
MLEIEQFRAEYGEEHTVGLSDIVATDFMSSEHSDEGVIDKIEYAQHRCQHGGDDAFEIRREMWRSEQVSRYCQVLTLRQLADFPLKLNRVFARLQTFSDHTRQVAQENRAASGRRASVGKSRRTRYQGLRENANDRCPPVLSTRTRRRYTMCASLVSHAWARSTGNTKHCNSIPDDPVHYSILSLSIPNTDIDPQYWGYLADDEAEDGEVELM